MWFHSDKKSHSCNQKNTNKMKKELPLVTIMIPTYNQSKYICEAVDSALNQDYPNLEVIVTDDCSTDDTEAILSKYNNELRFHYYKNTSNLGRVGNYHSTLYNHANGEWVINLDGDDYYTDPTYISRAMQRILSHENVVCYFGRRYISTRLKKLKKNRIAENCYLFNGCEYFLNYFYYGGFAHAGTLYKRKLAIADQRCYTYQATQSDFHGIIRYCLMGNIIISQESVYHWRVHGTNATFSLSHKSKYKNELLCQRKIIEDISGSSFNEQEKTKWLLEGKKWARYQYLRDVLTADPSLKTITAALIGLEMRRSNLILVIKALFKVLGFKCF